MDELLTLTRARADFVENVLPDLLHWRRSGLQAALVTLVGVEGSSPRPIGSQMAVNEHGAWVGNITSGCAEAAIAAEAVQVLQAKKAKVQRYGNGSRYLDIKLPCGSGIDVFFDPFIPTELLEELGAHVEARDPVALLFGTGQNCGGSHAIEPLAIAGPHDQGRPYKLRLDGAGQVSKPYLPAVRANIAGRGPAVQALAQISRTLGWNVVVTSPDEDTLSGVRRYADEADYIAMPDRYDPRFIDGWTASVLLFHDHEWEPPILQTVLNAGGFYVGALGSRRTHDARCAMLADLGCEGHEIQRIRGPIGLDIGALSPPEIALAIASEILASARGRAWTPPPA